MSIRARLPVVLLAACASGCDPGGGGAPAAAPAVVPPAAAIPGPYLGRYAADPVACGTPGDPSRLEITADTIRFHESNGPVLAVAAAGDGIAIATRLTGEGETRGATYRFALRDGVLTDLDGGMERVRCD